jgi:hypothetical protein
MSLSLFGELSWPQRSSSGSQLVGRPSSLRHPWPCSDTFLALRRAFFLRAQLKVQPFFGVLAFCSATYVLTAAQLSFQARFGSSVLIFCSHLGPSRPSLQLSSTFSVTCLCSTLPPPGSRPLRLQLRSRLFHSYL